jgi:MSHA biogenesis protein MshP
MCPEPKPQRMHGRPGNSARRGFSIISALFLLVVFSALGAFMLTFSTAQHTASAQDIEGARAYQAARTGVEWALYQVLQVSPTCPSAAPLAPLGGSLSGFTVTVACVSPASYDEGGKTVTVYQITSTAKNSAAPGSSYYVERQLQATVSR